MNISEDFLERHPQLFHYTTIEALLSILSTNSLWASHHAFLNDITELMHLEDTIKRVIRTHIDGIPKIRQQSASEAVEIIYNIIYKDHMRQGGVLKTLFEQYIISCCTHATLSDYTCRNGLLSQWISYGDTAGCAIVFDTRDLVHSLHEQESRHSIIIDICEMTYNDSPSKIDKTFPRFATCIKTACDAIIDEKVDEFDTRELLDQILDVGSRLKHEAFSNEHEVRIAVIRVDKEQDDKNRHQTQVEYRMKRRLPIPYVQLFGKHQPLPIRKIIIGPAQDQIRIQQAVVHYCSSLGRDIEVARSQTPLAV